MDIIAELQVALLWLAFAGSHIGLSSPRIRNRLRLAGFRGLYSLIAFAIFIPLIAIYFRNRLQSEHLFCLARTPGFYYAIYVLMGAAFVLVVAAILQPSPASITAGRDATRVVGMARITRHPLMMGFALLALTHMLVSGQPIDLVFFGGFAAFSIAGAWHQGWRMQAEDERFAAFSRETPFVPFGVPNGLLGLRELSP